LLETIADSNKKGPGYYVKEDGLTL